MSVEQMLFIGLLALIGAAAASWLAARRGPIVSTQQTLDLEALINRRISEATAPLKELIVEQASEISRLRARVTELETLLHVARGNHDTTDIVAPLADLLAIFGPDDGITERDRAALKRARVDFVRLLPATRQVIEDEVRRRRKDGNPWQLVHIASHGGVIRETGREPQTVIQLADGHAPANWWAETFDSGKILLLASCESGGIADELNGIFEVVVYFRVGVGNEAAADFTEAFWERVIGRNMPASIAYAEARGLVPAVREFVDIRRKRKGP